MFGLSSIRLAVYAVVAAAFLALAGVANHYHNQWVESEKTIATTQVELNAALEAVNACSDATDHLRKLSEEKTEVVKKAQEQAALLAKKNNALADRILGWEPGDADRCKAIKKLHENYKAETSGVK